MDDPRVDPESGATRSGEAGTWRRLGGVALTLCFAAVVLWAVWSWTPFGLRIDVGELEARVEVLERLHVIEHKREKLAQEYQRRLELEPVPEPGVSL